MDKERKEQRVYNTFRIGAGSVAFREAITITAVNGSLLASLSARRRTIHWVEDEITIKRREESPYSRSSQKQGR